MERAAGHRALAADVEEAAASLQRLVGGEGAVPQDRSSAAQNRTAVAAGDVPFERAVRQRHERGGHRPAALTCRVAPERARGHGQDRSGGADQGPARLSGAIAVEITIRVPSFNQYLSKRFDKLSQEQFDAFVDKHPIRKQFYKKMRKERGFDERESDSAIDRLRQTIDRMERGLEKSGGPWLMGENLTLADYCIVPTIDRMRDLGLGALWADHALVSAWFDRVQEQPAYTQTYYQGTRLSEIYDGASYGMAPNTATIVRDSEEALSAQA